MATNVVVVVVLLLLGVVVVIRFAITKAFLFHNGSSSNFSYRLVTIFIMHSRTVADFQVKS